MDTTAPPGFIQSPPVMVVSQQQTGHHSGGHFGPVIGVLAVIAVLGMLAGLVGRLCSGRTVLGYGPHFDVEAWVENKCSSCLDGHVARQPPPQLHPHMAMENHPTVAAAGGWLPQNNDVPLRRPPQHNYPSNVTLRTPPPPQPPQQHLKRNPQPSPSPNPNPNPDMEVHLRPLPTRQASISEMRGSGEPEITSADEEHDDRQHPVNGDVEDEMSDSTEDHDELRHRHRNHQHQHDRGGDDDESPHRQQH